MFNYPNTPQSSTQEIDDIDQRPKKRTLLLKQELSRPLNLYRVQLSNNFGFRASTSSATEMSTGAKRCRTDFKVEEPEENICANASTQTETVYHANKWAEGLMNILQNGKYSDVYFIVKDREFKVHKNILAAYSPVFEALMDSENPIKIEDCDPDDFADFLHFLYTGNTKKLNSNNVVQMYALAKKYQVSELCTFCVKYMTDHISLDNFCDIMKLSLHNEEEKLMEVASEYFMENSVDIVETAKWLVFLKDNTLSGNSLFLKALKKKKKL